MATEKNKTEFQEYLEVFKHWQLWIFGLLIPILIEGISIVKSYFWGGDSFSNIINKTNFSSAVTLYILSIALLSIPKYCVERFSFITNEINDQMKKLEKCPKMVALHTDNKVLESKFDLIKKAGDHKWLLSELLSKMIEVNCKDFSFDILSVREFIKFTSDLAKIRTKEVKVYTLISVFTWLDSFIEESATKDEEDKFYNNLKQDFPLDKALLKEYISNKISAKRYVFLSQFEWDNKYLTERYLDEYYKINGIDKKENIYFIYSAGFDYNKYKKEEFGDECVMYDDTILLSYKNDNHLMSYLSDIDSKKLILDRYTKGEYRLNYYELKEKIIEQKMSILKEIISNSKDVQNTTNAKDNPIPKISHTLSFLFRGNKFWQDYQRREIGFNDYSKRALNDCLRSFMESKQGVGYKIVEIGPGDGSKTKLILNTLGAENIAEYHLIDVNDVFLDIAENILKDHKIEYKKHMLDICDKQKMLNYKYSDGNDEKRIEDIFHGSFVIIATNSSLFCEKGFNLDIFSGCKSILLTIQVLSGEEKEEGYIKRKYSTYERLNLLIHPLRAFNVPIEYAIARNYLEVEYKDDKLKINFKLKDYLSKLKKEKEIEMNINAPNDFSGCTEKYKTDYASYQTLLNKFIDSEKITIYETLKFEDKCCGKTKCEDTCKGACNIYKCSYFDKFNVKCGFTKDHNRISKYAFILLKKR